MNKEDFIDEECSACNKKHIDIRTDIITPDKPNGIKKMIMLRCEEHLDCDADKMEYLSLLKSMHVKAEDLKFDTCASPQDNAGSAELGVTVTYKPTNTIVSHNEEEYQFSNKIKALRKLRIELKNL